jgi:hypothetical protein
VLDFELDKLLVEAPNENASLVEAGFEIDPKPPFVDSMLAEPEKLFDVPNKDVDGAVVVVCMLNKGAGDVVDDSPNETDVDGAVVVCMLNEEEGVVDAANGKNVDGAVEGVVVCMLEDVDGAVVVCMLNKGAGVVDDSPNETDVDGAVVVVCMLNKGAGVVVDDAPNGKDVDGTVEGVVVCMLEDEVVADDAPNKEDESGFGCVEVGAPKDPNMDG